jgi:hypothetical protein
MPCSWRSYCSMRSTRRQAQSAVTCRTAFSLCTINSAARSRGMAGSKRRSACHCPTNSSDRHKRRRIGRPGRLHRGRWSRSPWASLRECPAGRPGPASADRSHAVPVTGAAERVFEHVMATSCSPCRTNSTAWLACMRADAVTRLTRSPSSPPIRADSAASAPPNGTKAGGLSRRAPKRIACGRPSSYFGTSATCKVWQCELIHGT